MTSPMATVSGPNGHSMREQLALALAQTLRERGFYAQIRGTTMIDVCVACSSDLTRLMAGEIDKGLVSRPSSLSPPLFRDNDNQVMIICVIVVHDATIEIRLSWASTLSDDWYNNRPIFDITDPTSIDSLLAEITRIVEAGFKFGTH